MISLVDCNNFFVSCERLFRPDLLQRPVLVLSSNDGCVVARSQEVRALDIPMGVPYFKVKNVIEHNDVVCFSSNFALYSDISQRMLRVLSEHVPVLEVYSIDEAFLDLTTLVIDDYVQWGNTIKTTIAQMVGIPVSVGIAPTKMLAKMASHYAKQQQKACLIDPQNDPKGYQTVLEATSIDTVWGVGRQLAKRFRAAGLKNAWQLAQASPLWLHAQIGITGTRMYRELHGEVAYPLALQKLPQKSLVSSRSFGRSVRSIHELETAVATFASQAAFRLRAHNQTTAVFGIFLQIRTPEGEIESQSASVPLLVPSNDTSVLVGAALALLQKLYDKERRYKKAGVFANVLSSANVCQTSLFNPQTSQQMSQRGQLMAALDSINHRYGPQTIRVGSIDPKTTQWQVLKERISPAYTTDWSALPYVHASSV